MNYDNFDPDDTGVTMEQIRIKEIERLTKENKALKKQIQALRNQLKSLFKPHNNP